MTLVNYTRDFAGVHWIGFHTDRGENNTLHKVGKQPWQVVDISAVLIMCSSTNQLHSWPTFLRERETVVLDNFSKTLSNINAYMESLHSYILRTRSVGH